MTEKLLTELKDQIASYTLIPSDGGRFEFSVNGKLIFSKLKEGRFPEYKEIRSQLPKPAGAKR